MSISGVAEWDSAEYELKQSYQNAAPRRYMSVLQSQVDESVTLVDANLETDVNFIYQTDALNCVLAQLNFPHNLRSFLDAIIGLSGESKNRTFTATNFQIGLRVRTGSNRCSDDSMERWVSRYKRKLTDWQGLKLFELVKIVPGNYDPETEKNLPTNYTVSVTTHLPKIVTLAQSKFYWRNGGEYRKLQNRAIREAAREYLYSLPECPPLKLTPPKILTEQEKFDRRYRTILTFLENNRDALHRLGIAHEDLFIYLVNDLAKLCFNPPGTVGHILTPQKNEPDRENSIWNKIKRGDGGLIASESLAAYLTMLNEAIPAESEFQTVAESEAERVEMDDPNESGESDENANLLKINDEDGWTNESIPTPERGSYS
jgi:hypothetical protein